MKKKMTALLIAMVLMLTFSGGALALGPDDTEGSTDDTAVLRAAVSLSSGLTHVSGSSYRPWATASTGTSDSISVSFKLYRVVGSTLTLVASASNSTTGTSVTASKSVTLSAGSYRLVSTGTSSTATVSQTRNYTVS